MQKIKIWKLLSVFNWYAFKKKDYKQSWVLLFRQTNLNDWEDNKKSVYLDKSLLSLYSEYILKKWDVLIGMSWSIGKYYIYLSDNFALQNQRVWKLLFFDQRLSKYVLHYLPLLETELNKKAKGVAVQNISWQDLENMDIPLVSLPHQQAIVAEIEKQMSRLDSWMASLEKLQVLVKQYKASILNLAIKWNLVPNIETWISWVELYDTIIKQRKDCLKSLPWSKKYKDPEPLDLANIYSIPKSWTWVNLWHITVSVKDWPHYSPPYVDKTIGIPFITWGNIKQGSIDFENCKFISPELHLELSKRCRPEKFDILYTKGWTTWIARVNDYDVDFNVWVHVAVLKTIPLVDPYYLQNALNSPFCYSQSQKYTHGVWNQDLWLTRMIKIIFPLPPIEEQKLIVAEVESRLSIIERVEDMIKLNIKRAQQLKQSILQQAFSGKLVTFEDKQDDIDALLAEIEKAKSLVAESGKMKRGKKSTK